MQKSNTTISTILDLEKSALKKDSIIYYNHVMRIYNYCLLFDDKSNNSEKYAVAAAFHDIGIWTHKTFDYLKPSINLAMDYLTNNGKTEWCKEVELMIKYHHKMSIYKGDYAKIVNTFRKADWIDVSKSYIRFGLTKDAIKSIHEVFPNTGFHAFLAKQTLRHFKKKPLNPPPMFKR